MIVYIITSIGFIIGGILINSILKKTTGNPKIWGNVFYLYGGIMGISLCTLGIYVFK